MGPPGPLMLKGTPRIPEAEQRPPLPPKKQARAIIMSEGRLYVRGVFTGYSRGLKTQSMNQAIVKLEGVNDAAGCQWYLGKRVAFVHKAAKNTKIVNGEKSRSRVIWDRVMRPHGQSGNVKVKFNSNLPSAKLASKVRVMLY